MTQQIKELIRLACELALDEMSPDEIRATSFVQGIAVPRVIAVDLDEVA